MRPPISIPSNTERGHQRRVGARVQFGIGQEPRGKHVAGDARYYGHDQSEGDYHRVTCRARSGRNRVAATGPR